MSARLTEEEFHTVIESIRREANISSRSGQMDRLLVAAATLKRDRAAILESERDLLAVLEHEGHGPADDPRYPDMPDAHAVMVLYPDGRHGWRRSCEGCAALANARKQDAPTGAGGGKQ